MRYPAEETAQKHQRILEQASQLFRERGFSGVSLSEIMKATGLTHGAFYNHFDSKDALISKSLEHASTISCADLTTALHTPEDMAAYVDKYLSIEHRDAPATGCLITSLGPEISREPIARAGFTTHIRTMIDKLSRHSPWSKKTNARRKALCTLSTMVGAMVLARGVDDPELSEEILRAVREDINR